MTLSFETSFFPPIPRPDRPRGDPDTPVPFDPQAYIDNPSTDYDELIEAVKGIDNPLGTIKSKSINIGIVGLGAAGILGMRLSVSFSTKYDC